MLVKFLDDFATFAGPINSEPDSKNKTTEKPVLVAPPYSLLQSERVIGRKRELELLNDWLTELPIANENPCYIIQGIGGMGKSALSWSWFLDSNQLIPLEGRMWWSFYDNNNFSDFVDTLYYYVLNISMKEIEVHKAQHTEHLLFNQLINSTGSYLVVLDGLERILQAYDSVDPYHKLDSMEIKSKNGAQPIRAGDGKLLLELLNAPNFKFLISTRLIPSFFVKAGNKLRDGVLLTELDGLNDEDALALWFSLGMNKEIDDTPLLKYFNQFQNYPLLIKVLAGFVSRTIVYREHGTFSKWLEHSPHSDVFALKLNIIQTKSHILDIALRALDEKAYSILYKMAVFKLNIKYAVLWDLSKKDFNYSESDFQASLNELEGRCLIGWDELTHTYDMHPVIRGIVWTNLAQDATKEAALHSVEDFISTVIKNEQSGSEGNIRNAELLLVLFGNYISQGKYEAALKILQERLNDLLLSDAYYSYFMECMDLLFPVSGEPKVKNEGGMVMSFMEAIDEGIQGRYNYARFKGMTHRLSCGNFFCEFATALAGNEYSKYRFNEEIYLRIHANNWTEIATTKSTRKSVVNSISFCLLDFIERGYLDQVIKINKRLKHALNKEWIEYHLYLRLNDFESARDRIGQFMYENPPFMMTRMDLLKGTDFFDRLVDVEEGKFENVTVDGLTHLSEHFASNNMLVYQIQVCLMMGKLYLSKDDLQNARFSAHRALALAAKIQVVKREAESYLLLAEICKKQLNRADCELNALKAFNLAYDATGYSDYWILLKAKEILASINSATDHLDTRLAFPEGTMKLFAEFDKLMEQTMEL